MSQVRVNWNGLTLGYLLWDDPASRSVFELDPGYQAHAANLSPLLINKAVALHYGPAHEAIYQGLPPMIADSLPDHFGNRVFTEWMRENKLSAQDLNPVERLSYVGRRGIGALEYEPDEPVPGMIDTIDFTELAEISRRVLEQKESIPGHSTYAHALRTLVQIGSSVGGAQPKVLVAEMPDGSYRAGDVLHADKDTRYHIVKLSYDSGTPWGAEKTRIEFLYNKMAEQAGLTLAPFALVEYEGYYHFRTERFDRVQGEKRHLQTLAALTGYSNRRLPYAYEDAFRVMERLGIGHKSKEALWLHMAFNVYTSNMDDHLKNLAFILDEQLRWQLSPSYDLTYPFDPYLPSLKAHKMSVNGKVKGVGKDDVLEVARKVGIRNPKARLERMEDACSQFSKQALALGVSATSVERVASDIAW